MSRRTGLGPAAVSVPQLVGLAVRAAQDLALDAGLFPVQRRPPSGGSGSGSGVVVRQSPAAGRVVRRSTRVMIWLDTGTDDAGDEGGGGSRVPTGPGPKVPSGTK